MFDSVFTLILLEMVRSGFNLLILIGTCICDNKWTHAGKDREETTSRIGENDDISNDNPAFRNKAFGYAGGPQLNHFTGAFGGNQGGNFGNPLQGHPSNGILVGPGGPTGIIGRPRPYYNNNNGFGSSAFGLGGNFGGYPGQTFGGQGLPGQGQGFGGGFTGQQGYGTGLGGFGGSGFPNIFGQGFTQLHKGINYGLVTPNQFQYGGRTLENQSENRKKSEKLINKISDKI